MIVNKHENFHPLETRGKERGERREGSQYKDLELYGPLGECESEREEIVIR